MATKYIITGAAAVLPLKAGSERYVYRGAVVSSDAITADGIEHALSLGLIEELDEPEIEQDAEVDAAKAPAKAPATAKPATK